MSDVDVLQDLVEDLCEKGGITTEDVVQLRGHVFPDGVVSAAEAAAVFRLDYACGAKDPEWTRFYVDALTDYFLWQSEPRGYVSDAQATQLIKEITHDGHVDESSELELLINICHWCTKCPETLALLALDAIKESVLRPETASYGSNRSPTVIAPGDVELIRKVIYAPGSPGGFTVTRHEAELLISLDQASAGEESAASWPDLFAKGVANALMFPRGAPVVPSAEEALRRQQWLDDRRGVGNLLHEVGTALLTGDIPFGEVAEDMDVFGTNAAREADQKEQAHVTEALARETIDSEEAAWLIGRIGDTPELSEGTVRLLRFIRENSPSIDPALEPLFREAQV